MDIPGFVEEHTRVCEVALLLKAYAPFFCAGDVQHLYRNIHGKDIDFAKFGFSSIEDVLEYGDKKNPKKIVPAPSETEGLYVCLSQEDITNKNGSVEPPSPVTDGQNERRPSDRRDISLDHLKFNIIKVMLDCLEKKEWAILAEINEAYNSTYPTKFEDDCGLVGCEDMGQLAELCKSQVIIRENDDGKWICHLTATARARIQMKQGVRLSEQREDSRVPWTRDISESPRRRNSPPRSYSKSPFENFKEASRRRNSGEKKRGFQEYPLRVWLHDKFEERSSSPWREERGRRKREEDRHERSPDSEDERDNRERKREKEKRHDEKRDGKRSTTFSDSDEDTRKRESKVHKTHRGKRHRKRKTRSPDSGDERDTRERKREKEKRHDEKRNPQGDITDGETESGKIEVIEIDDDSPRREERERRETIREPPPIIVLDLLDDESPR